MHIYKYLPSDRITFLHDSLLRFTQPNALNDPFELLPGITKAVTNDLLAYMRRELLTPPPSRPGMSRNERRVANRQYKRRATQVFHKIEIDQFIEAFYRRGTHNINSKLGILSLSRRWNSSLMWSHYCSSHAGFCVGFHRNHVFFQQESDSADPAFIFRPVTYSSERPVIPARNLNSSDALQIMLTKSLDWKYEEEERAIAQLSSATKTIVATPFDIALFEIPRDAIAEIIIGLRASGELRDAGSKLATTLGIPLYRASISTATYDMDRALLVSSE